METRVNINICFYCKKPIEDKSVKHCPHCNRSLTVIQVPVIKKLVSSFLGIFNRKYEYEVMDKRYKYLEKHLNK